MPNTLLTCCAEPTLPVGTGDSGEIKSCILSLAAAGSIRAPDGLRHEAAKVLPLPSVSLHLFLCKLALQP